ncbi:MAG: SDR family NAD(P)-dependent oxidoreductase [Caulobacteraceae bacterium]|nr:SDR family NAD(P)-dependent oxidoreductase [Caulobacteraceae bacterium]
MAVSKKRLDGKVAVVTGAGRGIGREEALLFAAQGAKVVVNDLGGGSTGGGGDRSVAQAVVEEILAAGGQAVAETSSVSSWEGGKAVIQKAIDAFGRIDILSNNAGIARPVRIDEMAEEDWDLVSGVSLKGYFATIRHAAPHFIAQRSGVIVNKSSHSAFGHYCMTAYSASKEGVMGLTRSVARDLGQFGVRCNAIRPGAKNSQMETPVMIETLKRSEELGFPALWNRWLGLPQVAPGLQENVAALTVWLCLDEAANVNGRDFFIMGAEAGIFPEPRLAESLVLDHGWTLDDFLNPVNREYLVGDVRNRFSGRKPA